MPFFSNFLVAALSRKENQKGIIVDVPSPVIAYGSIKGEKLEIMERLTVEEFSQLLGGG